MAAVLIPDWKIQVHEVNYIRVDEDDMDKVIRVYDSDGEVAKEFSGPRAERRYAAEVFAAAEAKRLGCEWGANYS